MLRALVNSTTRRQAVATPPPAAVVLRLQVLVDRDGRPVAQQLPADVHTCCQHEPR